MRVIKILVSDLGQAGEVLRVLGEAEVQNDLDFPFGVKVSDNLCEADAKECFAYEADA